MNERAFLILLGSVAILLGALLDKDLLAVAGSVFLAAGLVCQYMDRLMNRLKREQEQ